MASYVTPKINTEYITYISVGDQADTKLFKSSPTIAAGDFKVSTDGGALGNLTTLPVVTPAGSKMIKVTLSATEMNGDNVTLIGSDAAGAEWTDFALNVQTSARQIDDLAFPTTSGRSLDITATGAAGIDWGNVENKTTANDLSGTDIQLVDTTTTNTDMRGTNSASTLTAGDILTTALTESYAADTVAPTLSQAIYLIQQTIQEFAITGTTITVKKLDGSTTAATYTLDDATSPTSRTRAT